MLFMFGGFLFLSVESTTAQTLTDWDSFIEKLLDKDEELSTWSYLYEDLCDIHENPININASTTEDFFRIPFLTEKQIEEIQAYVYMYGPVKSMGELSLIKGIDYETRQLLSLFVYCGEPEKNKNKFPSLKNLLHYGKNELVLRSDIPFYSLDDAYLGTDNYHSIRYKYKYGQKVEVGILAEKDMGEPFVKGKGFDYYSFYSSVSDLGILKKLVIGNYRLHFGQGLVLNTNFNLGKYSIISSYADYGKGIKGHSSFTEYNYFKGIASTLQLGKFLGSFFLSDNAVDATLKNEEISTLKEDGYHRTLLEIAKKGNVIRKFAGFNLSAELSKIHLGLTGVYTWFSHDFLTHTSGYNLYYPRGNHFLNASIDYSYKSYRFSIAGEWALDFQGGWAVLNRLNYRLGDQIQLVLLHRYYDKKYNSFFASSFAENGSSKNEHGIYVGLNYPVTEKIKLSAYADLFQFPYLKYRVSMKNTKGMDVLGEMNYQGSDHFSVSFRYRNKVKQGDYKDETTNLKGIAYTVNQKIKLQLNYILGSKIKGKTILNYVQENEGKKPVSRGYSFGQSFQGKIGKLDYSLNGIYFHTDDYDSRVYCYEQNMLYSFSMPSYYGKGYRLSVVMKYPFTSHLYLQCKYGMTKYLEEGRNDRSLLALLVNYKF